MRKIKFRVWDGDTMHEGTNLSFGPNGELSEWFMAHPTHALGPLWKWRDRGDWVALQYTGLKDNNGTEIYEGDLIQNVDGGRKIEVKWETEAWDEDGFHTGFHFYFTADQYEVVGNIYE